MRIVIDMQGAQACLTRLSSCYITKLACALARQSGEHEVILALSGLFDGTIEAIRAQFHGVLPSENIHVWSAPGPVNRLDPDNEGRAKAAELIREAFLANLNPDLVLLSNVFDSDDNESILTIGVLAQSMRSVVVLESLGKSYAGEVTPRGLYWAHQIQQIRRAELVMVMPPLDPEYVSQVLGLPAAQVNGLSANPATGFEEASLRDDAGAVLALLARRATQQGDVSTIGLRQKLAYVSPLPPQKSGIAGYSAELLPELSRYYDIDVVTDHSQVNDPWILANCQVRSVEWFRQNAKRYQRVIYHFGNNPMHAYMFELLDEIAGVVVLHDFYLSDVQWYCQVHGIKPDVWIKELYQGHGYKAVADFHQDGAHSTLSKYPGSLGVINQALGVIVHSNYSESLARQWYDERARSRARFIAGTSSSGFMERRALSPYH